MEFKVQHDHSGGEGINLRTASINRPLGSFPRQETKLAQVDVDVRVLS